jgi:tetratricopeptide (TPR) repeat protein
MGLRDRPTQAYRRAVARAPEQPEALVALGFSLSQGGQWDDAAPVFGRALQLAPNSPSAAAGAAEVLMQRRDLDSAWALVEPHIGARRPDERATVTAATIARQRRRPQDALASVRRALKGTTESHMRTTLLHTLGEILDETGDAAGSFQAFDDANKNRRLTFEIDQHEHTMRGLAQLFDEQWFAKPTAADPTQRPVLIVGAPRSGTSLTEQVLASHPKVAGGGELEALRDVAIQAGQTLGTGNYLAGLDRIDPLLFQLGQTYLQALEHVDPRADRVTDKMPHNFEKLWCIRLLFPQAPIIHCTRNVYDIGLSCYFQMFGERHRYSRDLADLAHHIAGYRRLMAHWRTAIDGPFLEVAYEDVVAELEAQSRRLVDFVGLDWDPACLAFHENRRFVATASYNEVRRPIYTRSAGRHVHYDEHLAEFKEILEVAEK